MVLEAESAQIAPYNNFLSAAAEASDSVQKQENMFNCDRQHLTKKEGNYAYNVYVFIYASKL